MLKDKLREYRTNCGFSQQQVAEMLNMHRSTYSYYETGKTEPSLDNLRMLSKMFAVSMDELLELNIPGSASGLGVSDRGYDDGFVYLREDSVERVSDLTRDEKTLILRFRLMTEKQRRELLQVMKNPGGENDPTGQK